ncbi:MAG: glycosyltransferase family 2 protein, partial [Candidatus Marinimicrobia bacterium]|nr:glycosyltransferase family 2 protein [Candidatus Neomarinimicrobiota bacterium]
MIDIILPIYKADEIVYKSIDSVINQTYKDWHLIIIDDASKDGMLQNIKDKYINYNNKISYIKLDRNLRAAGARNFAISKSDGKYISFIDQDDLWKKNKLTEYINYFNNNINVKLVHSNIECIDKDNKIVKDFFNRGNYMRNQIPYSKLNNYEMAKHLFNYY